MLSSYALPKKCPNHLDSINTNFFWGFNGNKPKIHLLSKKVLQNPKCRGGLGIRKVGLFNKALLAKQVLRVIDKKYYVLSKWINIFLTNKIFILEKLIFCPMFERVLRVAMT